MASSVFLVFIFPMSENISLAGAYIHPPANKEAAGCWRAVPCLRPFVGKACGSLPALPALRIITIAQIARAKPTANMALPSQTPVGRLT